MGLRFPERYGFGIFIKRAPKAEHTEDSNNEKPKGVIVPHKGVVRLVINTNYIKFKSTDRILQNIAIVFDASVFACVRFLEGMERINKNKNWLGDE